MTSKGKNMGVVSSTPQHPRHFTATGYVVNKKRTKILMIHHKKLNKWLPPGGHLETDELPHKGAIREVFEETGIVATPVRDEEHDLGLKGIVDTQIPRPYALLYQLIPKSSKDVEHIHLDMVYLLEADDEADTTAQLSEVSDVRWHSKDDVLTSDDVFDSVKGFVALNLIG